MINSLSINFARSLAFVAIVAGLSVASAEEHAPQTITGTTINLFERDHAFAGDILERPVFGVFEHAPFGSSITMRKGEQSLTLKLVKSASDYAGMVEEQVMDPTTGATSMLSTSVRLVRIEKPELLKATIVLDIDGQEVFVDVEAPSYDNNHFQSPTFSGVIDGHTVKFHFTGEACLGYSSSIALMIFGAYAHLSK